MPSPAQDCVATIKPIWGFYPGCGLQPNYKVTRLARSSYRVTAQSVTVLTACCSAAVCGYKDNDGAAPNMISGCQEN